MNAARRRLVYLVTEDWYFCSHRLPLAVAAREAGFDVAVATRVRDDGERIRDAGLRLLPVEFERGRIAPARDLATLAAIGRIYRAERPDLVHHVAMKPLLYGGIAAARAGVPAVVNAVAGMGFVFSSGDRRARLLRPLLRAALGWSLRQPASTALVQNPDDRALLAGLGVPGDRIRTIPGSGVDTRRFRPSPEPEGEVVVALVARMLRDKGVEELVAAARLVRARHPRVRFRLVGDPDPDNPASIAPARLAAWRDEGIVEWDGPTDDVAAVWAGTHVAALPSYREGLPKSLLESAACGRPAVATDVPGCRAVVRDGETGLLVPPRDPAALAAALVRLVEDPGLRQALGANARALVEREMSLERVIEMTLDVYAGALAGLGAAA